MRAPRTGAILMTITAGACLLFLLSPVASSLDVGDGTASAQAAPTPMPYTPLPGCDSTGTPAGQANPSDEPEPMSAIWCYHLNSGPTTRVAGANDWVDDFQTDVQMQTLGAVNQVSGNNIPFESRGSGYEI